MECELCGSRSATTRAKIEGVVLSVCEKCVKYGEEIKTKPVSVKRASEKIERIPELEEDVIENFSEKVKELRTAKGLSQRELASAIKEKVSVIKRIEEGWIPPAGVIKKLERFFEVKLREKYEFESISHRTGKEDRKVLTMGDVVEIKMRKNR